MGRNHTIIGLELDWYLELDYNWAGIRRMLGMGLQLHSTWAESCRLQLDWDWNRKLGGYHAGLSLVLRLPPFSSGWVAGKQDCSYISKTHMRMYRRTMELKMTIMNRRKLSGQSRADSQGIHYITKRFVTSTHTHTQTKAHRLQFVLNFSGTCSCSYKLQASWCILTSFPDFFCSSVCIIYRSTNLRTKNRVGLGMRLIHTVNASWHCGRKSAIQSREQLKFAWWLPLTIYFVQLGPWNYFLQKTDLQACSKSWSSLIPKSDATRTVVGYNMHIRNLHIWTDFKIFIDNQPKTWHARHGSSLIPRPVETGNLTGIVVGYEGRPW